MSRPKPSSSRSTPPFIFRHRLFRLWHRQTARHMGLEQRCPVNRSEVHQNILRQVDQAVRDSLLQDDGVADDRRTTGPNSAAGAAEVTQEELSQGRSLLVLNSVARAIARADERTLQ